MIEEGHLTAEVVEGVGHLEEEVAQVVEDAVVEEEAYHSPHGHIVQKALCAIAQRGVKDSRPVAEDSEEEEGGLL